jgi:hypothetical protein
MLLIYLAFDIMGCTGISPDFLDDFQRFGITSCLILRDVRENEAPVSLETPVIKI